MADIIVSGVIGLVFTLLGGFVLHVAKSANKRLEALSNKFQHVTDGTRALLRYRLVYNCNYYIRLGCITYKELDEIKILHKEYKSLGGNGTVDVLVRKAEVLRLVTIDEIEKEKNIKFSK